MRDPPPRKVLHVCAALLRGFGDAGPPFGSHEPKAHAPVGPPAPAPSTPVELLPRHEQERQNIRPLADYLAPRTKMTAISDPRGDRSQGRVNGPRHSFRLRSGTGSALRVAVSAQDLAGERAPGVGWFLQELEVALVEREIFKARTSPALPNASGCPSGPPVPPRRGAPPDVSAESLCPRSRHENRVVLEVPDVNFKSARRRTTGFIDPARGLRSRLFRPHQEAVCARAHLAARRARSAEPFARSILRGRRACLPATTLRT